MFEPGQTKGTVRFTIKPDGIVRKAMLAGDFTGWRGRTMRKQKNGSFTLTVPVAPGPHEYKFLLDGAWVVDPDNSAWALNPYGTLNSVLQAQ